MHRSTLYFNSGDAWKVIDHVLLGCRWRLAQNCRVFRSAEFAGTDDHYILLVTTLKIRLKFREMALSSQVLVDVRRLRNVSVALEHKRELDESLGELNDSFDREKLWTDIKTQIVKGVGEMFAIYTWKVQELPDQGDPEHHRGESQG